MKLPSPMPLSLDKAHNNSIYMFHKIDDAMLRLQLVSRGFVPGAIIKVVRAHGRGSVLIEIKHARMAVGRLEAVNIFVLPLTEE
ncbi:MAG: FeoA family protein [Candidatus Omnitrophota bacterium]